MTVLAVRNDVARAADPNYVRYQQSTTETLDRAHRRPRALQRAHRRCLEWVFRSARPAARRPFSFAGAVCALRRRDGLKEKLESAQPEVGWRPRCDGPRDCLGKGIQLRT